MESYFIVACCQEHEDTAHYSCLWRIVISPRIPQDFPFCYDSAMRNDLTPDKRKL